MKQNKINKVNGIAIIQRLKEQNANFELVSQKSNINTSVWGWDCWQDSHRRLN